MHGATAETIAVVLLLISLAAAIIRPFGIGEAIVAVPCALLLIAVGIISWHQTFVRVEAIGPTVGFLAAILVFGHLCAEAGVFDYLGGQAAAASRGRPRRLLVVVALAAAVTAVLTLDATVVLLTPVVLTTLARLRIPVRPHSYACTRLANSGSLLLPVSNLTNLLAFAASGLSFGKFAALMVVPWVLACLLEWIGLRLFFRADLPAGAVPDPTPPRAAPAYALVVLALTVVAFVVTSSVDVSPAWAAIGGCLLLLVPRARSGAISPRALLRETNPSFCVFVLALAVIVDAVAANGLQDGLRHLVPNGTGLLALLGAAFLAAALANMVNNLPATLALIPLVTGAPALLLAVLIGVNVGPNLTYGGSLATLLWRRLLPAEAKPRAREFHLLGVLTVPAIVAVTTVALWGGYELIG